MLFDPRKQLKDLPFHPVQDRLSHACPLTSVVFFLPLKKAFTVTLKNIYTNNPPINTVSIGA
jgi:hypothetical protein